MIRSKPKMNFFGVTAYLLLACTLLSADQKPNFVIVLADDCTFRDLGCYGGQAKTPNMDRIAAEGLKFERCFQAAPMCSPTRHNLYTGLYPVRSGAYPNHTFAKPGTKSICHYLEPLGYRVALSGKKHIATRKVFPFEYSGNNNPDMNAIDKLFAECKSSQQPFCLFACSNEPHSPWNKGDTSTYPSEKIQLPSYIGDTPKVRHDFSHYLAEITYFDSQVGKIDRLLKKHQLDQNTMLIVLSEQGNGFPFAKWTCYGNGLQSGMLVRWPEKVEANTTNRALVEYVDIVPTLVEAAGGKPAQVLEGKSLQPLLSGKTNIHKSHVFGIMTTRGIINGTRVYPIRTIRGERYRLIWNLNHKVKFTNACTQAEHFQSVVAAAEKGDLHAREVVRKYQHRPEFELYDCRQDPFEQKNLAGLPATKEIQSNLKARLDEWMKAQGDQGIETEVNAILRLRKNAGKKKEDVLKEWELKQTRRSGSKKKRAKKNRTEKKKP